MQTSAELRICPLRGSAEELFGPWCEEKQIPGLRFARETALLKPWEVMSSLWGEHVHASGWDVACGRAFSVGVSLSYPHSVHLFVHGKRAEGSLRG